MFSCLVDLILILYTQCLNNYSYIYFSAFNNKEKKKKQLNLTIDTDPKFLSTLSPTMFMSVQLKKGSLIYCLTVFFSLLTS